MWKISWPSPFPYMVNTWPSPSLILPLHVHWFTTVFNYDPSLTMTSFLIPIIYNVLLSATSIEFLALRSNERSFHWNKLNSGNGETVADYFLRTILSRKRRRRRERRKRLHFVKNFNFRLRIWWRGKDCKLWNIRLLSTSSRELSDVRDSPVLLQWPYHWTSSYSRKRTQVFWDSYVPWQNKKSEWIWQMDCNKSAV